MSKSPKTGLFSRSLSLAKISVSAGAKAAQYGLGGLFRDKAQQIEAGKKLLEQQVRYLTKEARELKGAFAKVGQVLSTYGESFLPPEVNAILKSLQSQIEPLPIATIERLLEERLGPERARTLKLDPTPLGAASLGQVHRARILPGGNEIAVKVRYPGIEKAIDADLRLIRFMLSSAKIVPADMPKSRFTEIFSEARSVLKQEVDYSQELALLKRYREKLAGDPRFVCPVPVDEYCGEGVVATTLIPGVRVDSAQVKALSQSRRNRLATHLMELFLMEFLDWNLVQTDPHFGNYLIQIDPVGEDDKWVLLDFGAVRSFSETFKDSYLTLLCGVLANSEAQTLEGGEKMGLVDATDDAEVRQAFVQLARLAGEALLAPAERPFCYASSDLPQRIAKVAPAVIYRLKMRLPPREMVSFDRKLTGVYVHLVNLGAKLSFRDRVAEKLKGRLSD
jgi:predicted unusual protein kinase regulating ubiquinone biosynthesis (AarF/ABC1/UbiB family)